MIAIQCDIMYLIKRKVDYNMKIDKRLRIILESRIELPQKEKDFEPTLSHQMETELNQIPGITAHSLLTKFDLITTLMFDMIVSTDDEKSAIECLTGAHNVVDECISTISKVCQEHNLSHNDVSSLANKERWSEVAYQIVENDASFVSLDEPSMICQISVNK